MVSICYGIAILELHYLEHYRGLSLVNINIEKV